MFNRFKNVGYHFVTFKRMNDFYMCKITKKYR